MTEEQEKYYNNYLDLFMEDGWKQLLDDFKKEFEQLNTIVNVANEEDLRLKQGRLSLIIQMLSFEEGIKTEIDTLKSEDSTENPLEQ